jgi:uncharacterized SAM-binding protein YcdF (DUF218 family)
MKHKFTLLIILFTLIFFDITIFRKAGTWLVRKDELIHTDAAIILMGSIPDRSLQAADLYVRNLFPKVLIVKEAMAAYKELQERGVHIISDSEKTKEALIELRVPADSITILPGEATSTLMEAVIISEYLRNKTEIDTVLLVSSAPHLRRASMIFDFVFRKTEMPVKVICSPSIYTHFDAENWWRSKDDIQEVLSEYLKITNFTLFERRSLE